MARPTVFSAYADGPKPRLQLFNRQIVPDVLADALTKSLPAKRLDQVETTADAALADYLHTVVALQPQPLPQPVCRYLDEDEVLALALSSRADVVVPDGNYFLLRQIFKGIPVAKAAHALRPVKKRRLKGFY